MPSVWQLSAVRLEPHYDGDHIKLIFTASVINFPLLQLSELEIDPQYLDKFMLGKIDNLSWDQFGEKHVLVLPNLTSVKLVSMTKKLPPSSGFKTWDAMKTFWEKAYGYKMDKEPKFYFNVCFRKGSVLSYPEGVVMKASPRHLTDLNPLDGAFQFLQDLKYNSSLMCGQPMKLSGLKRIQLSKTCTTSTATPSPDQPAQPSQVTSGTTNVIKVDATLFFTHLVM